MRLRLVAVAVDVAVVFACLVPRWASAETPRSTATAPTTPPTQPATSEPVVVLAPPKPPAPAPTLPTLTPPPDLSPFVGKRVARVDVELEGESWGNTNLPRPTAVRLGDPLAMAAVRAGLDELTRTSRFARVWAYAAPDPSGVRVVFRVVARKVIDTLQVDLGGAKVDRDELLREADFSEGGELVGADLYTQQERMETFLARRGYPDATVAIEARSTDDPLRVVLVLGVTPGEPRVLEERSFYVSANSDKELREVTGGYRVKTRERADEVALEAADSDLEGKLHGRGYYGAKISHDVVRFHDKITLRVRIDPGPRILPRFEGNDSFDADALTEALELETETDLNAGRLSDKLRDFYRKHGFYDADVGFEERGGPKDPVHHRVFKIAEQKRVAVSGRSYPCLKVEELRRLRKRTLFAFINDDSVSTPEAVGREIDSFLEEELPGADLLKSPDPRVVDELLAPAEVGASHPAPIDLDPIGTYFPATYDRAVEHLQQLFRNEGYLHAQVGPVQVLRRRCDPKSRLGRCDPLPLPKPVDNVCSYDATGLPLPVAALDPALSCVPDPQRGLRCESRMALRIPIKLGPRVELYDLRIRGARYLSEEKLAREADVALGRPVNVRDLEDSRRRVLDAFKEEGFAYAEVKVSLDESPDHTRGRATLDVQEGDQVVVRDIVIQGNELTSAGVIGRRIALQKGRPYRLSDVRKTQERIATLGVFSSVTVGLADPYVPQREKTVIITVTEVEPKFVEIRPGFSTGEGVRVSNEFGDRNLFSSAIGFSTRLQLSYLPDALIIDPGVRQAWHDELRLPLERMAGRVTTRFDFPEVGLGPLMRMSIEGIGQQQPRRDFRLRKIAGIPTLMYRPRRELMFSLSQSVEYNEALIFGQKSIQEYTTAGLESGTLNLDIARLLRVPDGKSNAYAQRFVVTWDRRDASFNPRRGTYIVSGVEHVDWYSGNQADPAGVATQGHVLRFTQTVAGYVPLGRKLTFAAEVRLGWNYQLTRNSQTYPDRLFFLGGFESMRAWYQDTLIPQEDIDHIVADARNPPAAPAKPFTAKQIPVRGGNLMVNPKVELRIPLGGSWETVAFTDLGNLWHDPSTPFDSGRFPIRVAVGSGVRYQTPIGPAALDVGINVTRFTINRDDPTESFGAVQFGIGVF